MIKQEPLKLIQANFSRKRFVVGQLFSLDDSVSMYQIYNNGHKELLEKTTFNLVSDTPELGMKFFVYPNNRQWQAAYEVVGVPQTDSQYIDFNQLKVLKYQTHLKPWQISFHEIHQKGLSILRNLAHQKGQNEAFYQIVICGNNLELHFFS